MSESEIRELLTTRLFAAEIGAKQFRDELAAALNETAAVIEGRPGFAEVAENAAAGKLAGANLARVNWRKQEMLGVKLAGSNLTKAKLSKGNLSGADLCGATLTGADLSGANLSGADLIGADLSGATLKEADLSGAKFDYATFKNISGGGVNLTGATATHADCTFTELPRAGLSRADFSGADLTDVNLSDSKVIGANFAGATLARTSFQNAQIEQTSFAGAAGERLNLNLAAITECDFAAAELPKADISNAFLEKVGFRDAKLPGAIFNVSEHREVDLTGAQLVGASLKSMVGYSEEELGALAERGAKVDRFLLRRFVRLLLRNRLAQAVTALAIIGLVVFGYWYMNNPVTWGYAKLERVAQERRGNSDFAGAEELYRIMLSNFSEHASKVAAARNALARLLMETKRFEEAESLFDSVISDFPDQTGAVLGAEIGVADILREQKRYDVAEAALLAITDKYAEHPQVIDAWDRLARLAKLQGRPDRAREIYEQVIGQTALDENSIIRAQFELAQMLHDNKEYEAAIAKLREIVSRFGEGQSGAAALSSVIQIEVERQNLEGAAKVLAELLEKYPEQSDSVLDGEIFYASALLNDNNYWQEGLQRLTKIFAEYPTNEKGYWAGKGIAEYYKRSERYDEAAAMLAQLQERFQGNVQHRIEITVGFAELDLLRGNPQAALDRLAALGDQLVEPNQARIVLDLRARVLAALGRFDEAQVTFRKLAELFPEDPGTRLSALLGEASLLAEAGRTEQAIDLYRKAAEASGQPGPRFDALQNIVVLLRNDGQWDVEERQLQQMREMFAEDPQVQAQVLLLIADNLRRREKEGEALELLQQVAAMNVPNRPGEALQAMIQIYSQAGNVEQVAKLRDEIAARFPQDRRAMMTAGIETAHVKARTGQPEKALADYRTIAAAGEPDFRRQALLAELQILVELQRVDEATQVFETIRQEFPTKKDDQANATLVYGQLLRQIGRGGEAEAMYRTLAEENGGTIHGLWALAGLAQYYLEQNQHENARQVYVQLLADPAVEKHPEEALRARQGLGMIGELNQDYAAALGEYEKALPLATSGDEKLSVRQSMVRALAEQGKIDEATALLAQLKESYPSRLAEMEASELTILGALARKGRHAEALAGYERIAGSTKSKTNLAAALGAVAQAHLSVGRLADAEKAYQRLRKAFADDPQQLRAVDLGLAGIHRQRNDFKRTLREYEKILRTYDDQATQRQALAAVGGLHAEMGQFDKAVATYERLLKNAGDSAPARATAMMGLADLAARRGDNDGAIQTYRDVIDLEVPDNLKIGAYHALAQLFVQQGRFTQARTIYEELAKKYPENREHLLAARFGEAETLRQNGAFDQATAIYQEVAEQAKDPNVKVRARLAIGRTQLDQNDYEGARETFAALVDDPTAAAAQKLEARVALGDLHRQAGDIDAAAEAYEKLAADSNDENLRHMARQALASIRMEQGRLDDAAAIFEQISKAPGSPARQVAGVMGLADLAMRRGDYEAARALYRKSRRQNLDAQQDLNALTAIAQTYVAEKDFKGAERAYDEILAKYGANAQAKLDAELGRANLLRDRGLADKALAAYRAIADEYGNAGQVYWALSGIAQIQGQRGRVGEAQAAYEEIATRFPENATGLADAQLNEANVLKNSGRREEAENKFQEIIGKYPGTRQAAAAIEGVAQLGIEFQDFDQAETNFNRLVEEFGSDPSARFRAKMGLANLARHRGRSAAALTMVDEALKDAKRADDQVQALVFLARTYQEAGQNDRAEDAFKRLADEHPDHLGAQAEANMGRGDLRMAQGNFPEAITYFQKVVDDFRGKPQASGALQSLAGAYIATENLDAIEPIIQRLRKEHGDDPNAAINVHMNVANKLLAEERFQEAEARLDKVMRQYEGLPQTAWVRHAQAQSALVQQHFERAEKTFQAIKEEFSGNRIAVIDAELGLADLERARGNTDAALAAYEQIADQYSGYSQAVRALQAMANIYGEKSRATLQEQTYRRIIEQHGDTGDTALNAHMALGNLYRARDRFPEALEQYKAIYDSAPNAEQAAWAKAAAGRIYYQIGEEVVAEQLLRELVGAFPEDHQAVIGVKQFLQEIYERN
jgi:tetratricopeptide (TPR) repeat protein